MEHACAEGAIAAGGHVRIGFENNIAHARWQRVAESNAALIEVRRGSRAPSGRGVMSPADAAALRARLLG